MDDIYKIISETFRTQEFKSFTESSERFKIVHRCLDGVGINYNKNKILSVKAYCKILDSMPKFSNDFLRTFCKEEEFKLALLSLSAGGSNCMLNRETGLAGINIGIKRNPETEEIIRSVYVKTDPKVSYVLNYDGKELKKQKYSYIFNGTLKKLTNAWFKFGIPRNNHALEFSKRKNSSFATVYPVSPRKRNQRPSKMHEQYHNLFLDLNKKDEWEIEKEILATCRNNFPSWTPITKGYESSKSSRKIYLGTFSYKNSAFKHFRLQRD